MTDNKQRQRKKRGSGWEAECSGENKALALAKDALVYRSQEALRILSTMPNGHVDCIRTGKSEPDFHGVLYGGRAVMFDVKRTTSHRLPLPQPNPTLDKRGKLRKTWWHQVVALAAHTEFGGIGFLYVLQDDLDDPFKRRRFVLPVTADQRVSGLDAHTDRSVDLGRHGLELTRGQTWFDVVASNLEHWT